MDVLVELSFRIKENEATATASSPMSEVQSVTPLLQIQINKLVGHGMFTLTSPQSLQMGLPFYRAARSGVYLPKRELHITHIIEGRLPFPFWR